MPNSFVLFINDPDEPRCPNGEHSWDNHEVNTYSEYLPRVGDTMEVLVPESDGSKHVYEFAVEKLIWYVDDMDKWDEKHMGVSASEFPCKAYVGVHAKLNSKRSSRHWQVTTEKDGRRTQPLEVL